MQTSLLPRQRGKHSNNVANVPPFPHLFGSQPQCNVPPQPYFGFFSPPLLVLNNRLVLNSLNTELHARCLLFAHLEGMSHIKCWAKRQPDLYTNDCSFIKDDKFVQRIVWNISYPPPPPPFKVYLVEWLPNTSPMEIMYPSKQVWANCTHMRTLCKKCTLNLISGTSKKAKQFHLHWSP